MKTEDFIKISVPFLEDIYKDKDKRKWCSNYSVYSKNNGDIWNLKNQLHHFMDEAYESGCVSKDYANIYNQLEKDNIYREKLEKSVLAKLTDEQILSIIAMQFRNDHFCEGVLINTFVAEGVTLFYLKELAQRMVPVPGKPPKNGH